jgi:hypothetical protein
MRGMIDTTKPSPARMYDYYLGGKNNFAVDRAAANIALSAVPDGKKAARDNRDFLIRAVTHLASEGIGQFIDLGTGIPTSPNVHEVAQGVNPASVVAYVDNDPTAVVHGGALLADAGNGAIAIEGDIRHPLGILTNGSIQGLIDFSRPIGMLFVAVLHFITDAERPCEAVAAFRDHVAPGSCIVVSHITSDGMRPDAMSTIREAYREATAPAVFRSGSRIRDFFNGLSLVEPGLVEPFQWRPADGKAPNDPPASLRFLAGVGRKA